MSKIAQGVIALKLWMLPPLVGYKVVVGQDADISVSLTSLAGLAAKPPIFSQDLSSLLERAERQK